MAPLPNRRWWRRIERRARADFERDLLAAIRQLAADSPQVSGVELDVAGAARLVVLQFGRHRLTLAGVHPEQRRLLAEASGAGLALRLVAAGRYGRLWWITLAAGEEMRVVAASHARYIFGHARPSGGEGSGGGGPAVASKRLAQVC